MKVFLGLGEAVIELFSLKLNQIDPKKILKQQQYTVSNKATETAPPLLSHFNSSTHGDRGSQKSPCNIYTCPPPNIRLITSTPFPV